MADRDGASSESEQSTLSYSINANTEIYCDEFLGTSVVMPDRDLFMRAANELMEAHAQSLTKTNSSTGMFMISPSHHQQHHHPGSFSQRAIQQHQQPHPKHEIKADVIRYNLVYSLYKTRRLPTIVVTMFVGLDAWQRIRQHRESGNGSWWS
jgi:hypothetical protein